MVGPHKAILWRTEAEANLALALALVRRTDDVKASPSSLPTLRGMQRASRPEGLDLLPGRMQRSQSVSSDRTSISTAPSLTSPPPVAPDPAYIAASAASQIVTTDHLSQIDDWFHGDDGKEECDTIAVSPASLTLINGFLDYLLFSILAFARSTSIAALRPAVTEVLKPRLAKDAIDGADQELKEFLGGGDAEELSAFHHGRHQPKGKWDLHLVWRRTRLRCMVYTRLGDMEEEDEEMYIEQEHLEHGTNGDRRISRELALVSPAAAIFLTSILEFIGEHALMVAGEAASNRMDIRQHRNEHHASTGSTETSRLAVEDTDVEKLAFNTTLGRLWRSWKKRVRLSGSRPLSRELARRRAASSSASPSLGAADDPGYPHEIVPRPLVPDVLEEEQESARTPRNTESETTPHAPESEPRAAIGSGPRFGNRPHSMMVYAQPSTDLPLTPQFSSSSPTHPREIRPRFTHMDRRKRSTSLPNLRLRSEPVSPEETLVASHENPAENPAEVVPVDHDPIHVDERVPPDDGDPTLHPEDDAPSDGDDVIAPDENGDPVDLGTLSGYTGPQSSPGLSGSTMAVPGMKTFRVDRGRESLTKPPIELEAAMTWPTSKHPERKPGTAVPTDDGPRDVGVVAGGARMQTASNPNATEVHGTSKVQDDRRPQPPQLYTGWTSEGEWKRHLKSLQELPPSGLAIHHRNTSQLQSSQPDIEEPDHAQSHAPYPPPIRRTQRTTPDATHHRKEVEDRDSRQASNHATAHSLGAEYGALSLTPLKEIIDTGHGASDDSASFAPNHHMPMLEKNAFPQPSSDPSVNGKIASSLPSSARSQSRQSSRGEESTQKRKIPLFVDTSRPERAAVQRITPSPKDQKHHNRTSTSSNREVRPHTAASGASQFSQKVKGLIGRESTDSSGRPQARRNSSAGSGSITGEKGNVNKSTALSKQQSFEKLIKSDETIQYTLTPRNVRDLEVHASSNPNRHGPENSRNTNSYSTPEPANLDSKASTSPGRSVTSVKVLKALRSHPAGTNRNGSISEHPSSQPGREPSQPTSRTTRGTVPINGHVSSNDLRLANGRPGEAVPRDAKAKKETTSEIADFIRSTGPETIRPVAPNNSKADIEPLRSNPAKSGNLKATQSERTNPRRVTKPHPTLLPKTAGTASAKRPGPKLQARDATVSHDEQTSDLIDFIRQGPAPDRSDGSRRIPRSVAPFRRTMDSDEIQALGNGKAKDASSVTSTQDGVAQPQSVRSSSNSRTGLLESAKRWNGSQPHATSKPFRLDEPPRRKQHRNKDPYAIDIEDEDEDELNPGAKPEAHKETLVEFLRSMSPPPQGPTRSSVEGSPEANKKSISKRGSGPNIREQFARASPSNHAAKVSISKPTIINITEANRFREREKPRPAPPVSPLEPSPLPVTTNGTQYDGYKSTHPIYAAHVSRDRITPRPGRLQPRGEREAEPGLSELADFFKNSGPPTPPAEKIPPTLAVARDKEKEEGGLSRLFRRKKSAAKL